MPKSKGNTEQFGRWAFIIGIIVAILAALIKQLQTGNVSAWIFVILGLVVGFLNITSKKTTEFLLATIALMLVGAAGLTIVPVLGSYIATILKNIIAFVTPAALVVSLQSVWVLASKK